MSARVIVIDLYGATLVVSFACYLLQFTVSNARVQSAIAVHFVVFVKLLSAIQHHYVYIRYSVLSSIFVRVPA